MAVPNIEIPQAKLAEFCQRWIVVEFALFGSVLRSDFRPDSDVDVLVTFSPGERWSLFDLIDMQYELEEIFDRPVDILERDGLRNPFRRRSILSSMEVRLESEKLTALEVVAIQLEIEDEDLNEWREKFAEIKKKSKSKSK